MLDKAIRERNEQLFEELFSEFKEATSLTKSQKAQKLMGQLDTWSDDKEGIKMIYNHVPHLTHSGIFEGSPWENPGKLVSGLVNGTFKSGHPNSTLELLSELRILAIVKGDIQSPDMSRDEADNFIQDVIVNNLEFVFNEPKEETRLVMAEHELKKVHALFLFLSDQIHLSKVKSKLAEELLLICEQRPVVTEKQRRIIALVKERIELDPDDPEDAALLSFQRCIYRPTDGAEGKDFEEYWDFLRTIDKERMKIEAKQMGETMLRYGLVSQYQAVLLLHLEKEQLYELLPVCMGLNPTGIARYNEFRDFIGFLIIQVIHPFNAQCIYGLAKMLENGILSREAVRAGLYNISKISIHPEVAKRILISTGTPHKKITPKQYLMGSLFRILGQPLGVGQGNNPTCQSARGISMWSQHAPAKLIHMLQTAAVHNDLGFRFEGKEIKYSETPDGLVQRLDHHLDAVSVTLVPMLDRIYNEMMRRASGRGEDPHKWVNPAMYGQWIQIGFASAYDYLSDAIVDFDGFVRIFYAMCHPLYNGGHRLVYPNPVGIFITSAKGEMLGFHAVSLLRVNEGPDGKIRAYFLNPNNEGRQDWGQGIKPSVFGKGEVHGESSLPVQEFAARVYAFHYNNLEAPSKMDNVPEEEVQTVYKLAIDSWGKSYKWLEIKKKW
ncbi:hypothetical protein [Negadavirga shengliensis]|uniref:Uncharacterized protein n=1 Tax=Negadavirga shengliensis TaxID=1389218 RepID=A0ABV9SZH0_9BACT